MTMIRRSALVLAVRLVLLLFLIDTVYALLILAFLRIAPPSEYNYGFIILLWALHTVKYLILTIIMLRVLLSWLSRSYFIHDKQLTVSSGVIAVNNKVYELENIKQISIHQDWLGRLLGYGFIKLHIAGGGEDQIIELDDVADPKQYEKSLSGEFM